MTFTQEEVDAAVALGERALELEMEAVRQKKLASKASEKAKEAAIEAMKALVALKQELPLFDQVKDIVASNNATASDPAPQPEAWRAVALTELVEDGLTKGDLKILEENGITTLGQLCDRIPQGRGLVEIKGFGEARITRVENARESYFTRCKVNATPEPETPFDVNQTLAEGVAEREAEIAEDPEAALLATAVEAIGLPDDLAAKVVSANVLTFGQLEDACDLWPTDASLAGPIGVDEAEAAIVRERVKAFREAFAKRPAATATATTEEAKPDGEEVKPTNGKLRRWHISHRKEGFDENAPLATIEAATAGDALRIAGERWPEIPRQLLNIEQIAEPKPSKKRRPGPQAVVQA